MRNQIREITEWSANFFRKDVKLGIYSNSYALADFPQVQECSSKINYLKSQTIRKEGTESFGSPTT